MLAKLQPSPFSEDSEPVQVGDAYFIQVSLASML